MNSVWILWGNNTSLQITTLLAHSASSALLALVLHSLLPVHYRPHWLGGWAFFFSVAFFIPLLGILGLSLIILPALCWPRHPKEVPPSLQYLRIPALPHHSPEVQGIGSCYEQAKLAGVLQRSPDPDKRLSAVLATLRLQNKDAIALLRLALRDSEDDVRLLAYALLDRKEQAITERIMFSLEQLQNAPSDKKHFKLHQVIAYDCWELIYSGLAQGEVSTYWLETACKHAEAALKLNPYHAGLRFLYGIILLRQAKLDKAHTAFIRAEQLGIASNKVAPFLAEISFLKKRFCEVRHHLVSNDPAAFQQPLTVLAS